MCPTLTLEIGREMKALFAKYELKNKGNQKTKEALAAVMSHSVSSSMPMDFFGV